MTELKYYGCSCGNIFITKGSEKAVCRACKFVQTDENELAQNIYHIRVQCDHCRYHFHLDCNDIYRGFCPNCSKTVFFIIAQSDQDMENKIKYCIEKNLMTKEELTIVCQKYKGNYQHGEVLRRDSHDKN